MIKIINENFLDDTIEEENDSEQYHDYKYFVGYSGVYLTDSPKEAIVKWFKEEKTNRGDCFIGALTENDAMDLIVFASNNKDLISNLHKKYNCPYKLDYIFNSIDSTIKTGHTYIAGMYDQVDPFSVG